MSLLNLLEKRPSLAQGLEEYGNTPGAVLLDVRTPKEYAQGHLPGSVNLPLDRIQAIEIDKAAPLFVYCLSGGRSRQACAWLTGQGYTATNIGGISGYNGRLE